MHDGIVIVRGAADDPVGARDPVVIALTACFDVGVADGDVGVTVPTLVLVEETEDVAEFVDGHPFGLAPPKGRDVDVCTDALLEADQTGVVAGIGFASEEDILRLGRARNEGNFGAGIRPTFHGFEDGFLLGGRKFGNVVGDDTARPREGFFRTCVHMGGIGIGASEGPMAGQQSGGQDTKHSTRRGSETPAEAAREALAEGARSTAKGLSVHRVEGVYQAGREWQRNADRYACVIALAAMALLAVDDG
jgi:hypothetical protein